jgi:hypothetical protein
MTVEVVFSEDYATYKKGDSVKFSLDLAHQLISVEKVAKQKVKVKEKPNANSK